MDYKKNKEPFTQYKGVIPMSSAKIPADPHVVRTSELRKHVRDLEYGISRMQDQGSVDALELEQLQNTHNSLQNLLKELEE